MTLAEYKFTKKGICWYPRLTCGIFPEVIDVAGGADEHPYPTIFYSGHNYPYHHDDFFIHASGRA